MLCWITLYETTEFAYVAFLGNEFHKISLLHKVAEANLSQNLTVLAGSGTSGS